MNIIKATDTHEALMGIKSSNNTITFCQGLGGTGKSTLYAALQKENPNRTLCLASTGIAASNLMSNGVPFVSTIHSAFSLKPVDMQIFRKEDYINSKEILDSIDMILIDEISMVDCNLMDWILSLVNESRKHGHDIKIVMFGDVLQLPPVVTKKNSEISDIWNRIYGKSKYFFNAKNFDINKAQICMLTKIYRQKDKRLSDAITSLRSTPTPSENLEFLNKRVCNLNTFKEQVGDNYLTIVSTNKEKDAINDISIDALISKGAKGFSYEAYMDGEIDSATLASIPKEVSLYEGEKIMCTSNTDSYKNGTLATIVGFSEDEHLPIVKLPSGKETTIQYYEANSYVPVVNESGILEYELAGTIQQIAAVPAYACTIHKTQGLTLDALYYHASDTWIPPSGVYVALSRCKNINGIGLSRPIKQSDITYTQEAMSFYKSLLSA